MVFQSDVISEDDLDNSKMDDLDDSTSEDLCLTIPPQILTTSMSNQSAGVSELA